MKPISVGLDKQLYPQSVFGQVLVYFVFKPLIFPAIHILHYPSIWVLKMPPNPMMTKRPCLNATDAPIPALPYFLMSNYCLSLSSFS